MDSIFYRIDAVLSDAFSGVYAIVNMRNGHTYIGSACRGIKHRWHSHLSDLRKGRHHSFLLQREWNACGEQAFQFISVQYCPKEECISTEQRWMDLLDPYYNILRVAGSCLGAKQSQETRAKVSAAGMGRVVSPETRARISASHKGVRLSPAHRARISEAKKGVHVSLSPDRIAQLRERMIGNKRGLGYHHTADARLRIGLGGIGRHHSPEARVKISRALMGIPLKLRGRHLSPDTRAKISAAKTGVPRTQAFFSAIQARKKRADSDLLGNICATADPAPLDHDFVLRLADQDNPDEVAQDFRKGLLANGLTEEDISQLASPPTETKEGTST